MEKIVLLGCGGHAKSVVDALKENCAYDIAGFVDITNKSEFYGYPVLGNDESLQKIFLNEIRNAFICVGSVGDAKIRIKLYDLIKRIGYKIPNIISNSSILAKDIKLGEGIFIGKRAVINANSIIKNMAIINTGAIIEHDCIVGEFSHVSPGAVLCGDAKIGNNVHIGANATIIQGLTISSDTIIGAGSVVTHDITVNCIAYGNPCKEIKTK